MVSDTDIVMCLVINANNGKFTIGDYVGDRSTGGGTWSTQGLSESNGDVLHCYLGCFSQRLEIPSLQSLTAYCTCVVVA